VDSPFNFTVTATNYVNTSSLALSIALGASSITQVAPTSDSTTVDLSSAYTKQLNVTVTTARELHGDRRQYD